MNPNHRGIERCWICDGPTGRAGRGEDSIYCDECEETAEDYVGPFCCDCWETHIEVIHKQSSPDYCMGDWG